jgi:octopine/nopaline transport system substrate-binding protein
MRRLFVISMAVILVVALAGPGVAKEWKKIKIATEGAFAPWNFTDASGKLNGFEIELAKELCKRMGVEYDMVPQAWDGIIPALQAGKYDAIMAAMSITEKRKKVVSFSRYYAATPTTFIVLKDSPHAKFKTDPERLTLGEVDANEQRALDATADEFKGKTIGVQAATIQERFLQQYMKGKVKTRTYDTQENLELDLQAERIDAALGAMSYWVKRMASKEGENLVMVGPRMTGGPFGAGVGVAVRKDNQDLADKFSAAIDQMIDDGSLSKLAIKWFTFDASAKK